MIVRVFHGWTAPDHAELYEEFVLETIFPEMREIAGCVGAELARRVVGDEVEFLVITRFESLDAVRRFAGHDYERAVVEPQARELLLRFDEFSAHYETVGS
jgi:antibiotic biosynthesis monooxygenase (ABM) superfamily enzyme